MLKKGPQLIPLFFLFAFAFAGCRDVSTSSGNEARPASDPSNSNAANNQGNSNSGESKAPPARPQLLGTYTISEVQHEGVATMINPANRTEISFSSDGDFVRISLKNGKADHRDSGSFRIEGQDQLILRIVLSRGNFINPPVEKRHKIALSDDGNELKMTAADGKVAVFRRTRGLPGK